MTKSIDLLKTKDALVYGLCQFNFPAIAPEFSMDKDAVELNVGGALRKTKGSIPGVKRKLTSGMFCQGLSWQAYARSKPVACATKSVVNLQFDSDLRFSELVGLQPTCKMKARLICSLWLTSVPVCRHYREGGG